MRGDLLGAGRVRGAGREGGANEASDGIGFFGFDPDVVLACNRS
jgi:hypothetical protein